MTDHISTEHRSWNMSRIKGRDTSPEKRVRSMLHRMGYRFRLQRSDLPGKPDLVLPKYRTAVFVHGCFWHRHPGCKYATTPKSNTHYWHDKFTKNVARDTRNQAELRAKGWRVTVVWECELRDMESLAERLKKVLSAHELTYQTEDLTAEIAAEKHGEYAGYAYHAKKQ